MAVKIDADLRSALHLALAEKFNAAQLLAVFNFFDAIKKENKIDVDCYIDFELEILPDGKSFCSVIFPQTSVYLNMVMLTKTSSENDEGNEVYQDFYNRLYVKYEECLRHYFKIE